mgnify:CR=1 FL=1
MRTLRLLALATLLSGPVLADDPLFPIGAAWEWTYERVEGQGLETTEVRSVEQTGLEGSYEVATLAVLIGDPATPLPVAQRIKYGRLAGAIYRFGEATDRELHSYDPPVNFLEARIEPGASWTWRGTERWETKGKEPRSAPASIRFEVEGVEEVATGAGKMKAFRIRETHETSGVSIARWFVPGTGVVREEEAIDTGTTWSMTLESFRRGR